MKRWLLVIFMAIALASSFTTVTFAEEKKGGVFAAENFSSTVIFTTDYVFDGVSYSDQDPAVQASLDYYHAGSGIFLGIWGSSWDDGGVSNEIEMGIWAGQAGSLGPLGYDVTLAYWFYPGADDDGFEYDYATIGVKLNYSFQNVPLSPTVTVGAAYSPEYSFEDGTWLKFIGKLDLTLGAGFSLGLEAATVDVKGDKTSGNGNGLDGGDGYEWEYYRVGISKDLGAGFNANVSYWYNTEEEWFDAFYGVTDGVADSRVVLTLSRTF
jgi:uncharacterized protein (TIGR02001 family)